VLSMFVIDLLRLFIEVDHEWSVRNGLHMDASSGLMLKSQKFGTYSGFVRSTVNTCQNE
jgi:hypothetical protein